MELPIEIVNKIEKLLEGHSLHELRQVTFSLIDRYQNNSGSGLPLITSKLEASIYAGYRMPATYNACLFAISKTFELLNIDIKDAIDVGGGSGASSIAIDTLLNPDKVTILEKDPYMREVGNYLLDKKASYQEFDIVNDNLSISSDFVFSSYLFNELNPNDIKKVVLKMWKVANKVMIIVEPGTKKGYQIIKAIRDIILSEGGTLIAPCPHMDKCPMKEDDWCHFSTRVNRTKLHKLLKEGDVPYEDEKFSYIAFAKFIEPTKISSRIIRRPIINKGHIKVALCQKGPKIEVITISKRNGDLYKKVQKSKVGDAL